jgi:hypothetical protein
MRRLAFILMFAVFSAFAHAQDASDPLALITDIYKSYTAETDVPGYSDVYSKRLLALVDADLKAREPGDSGSIDWDVFVNGNDWQISQLAITLVSKSATRAQVRARFFNFKEQQDQLFDLIIEDGRWVIDDVRATQKGNRWTMSKILTHAPDAFPDEKPRAPQ